VGGSCSGTTTNNCCSGYCKSSVCAANTVAGCKYQCASGTDCSGAGGSCQSGTPTDCYAPGGVCTMCCM
jgi:hypothetical protein